MYPLVRLEVKIYNQNRGNDYGTHKTGFDDVCDYEMIRSKEQ
jgi:hypothetical protein